MKCPNCGTLNPDGATDCPQCGLVFSKWSASPAGASPRPESAQGPAKPREESSGAGPLLLAAAVLAGGWLAWRWLSGGEEAASKAESSLLSPAPFRAQLTELEAVLYKEGPPTAQDKEEILDATDKLIKRIPSSAGDDPPLRLQKFAGALYDYGGSGAMTPEVRARWIVKWEETRGAVFSPAAWLHAAAAPPPAAAATGPADPQEDLLALQRSSKALSSLLDAASKETTSFGESSVAKNDAGAADKKRLDAWRDWVANWLVRVDTVMQGLPAPDRLTSETQEGGLLLHRIVVDLRAVPDTGPDEDPEIYLPDKSARDAWLSSAKDKLKLAEETLQKSAPQPAP